VASKKAKKSKAATAVPKATTQFEVTVTDSDTKAPLPGAKVEVNGGTVKHPSNKTNAKGLWLSRAVGPGTYDIVVTMDHWGPPVVQPPPPAPQVFPVVGPVTVSQTIAAGAIATAKTPVKVAMSLAEATVKFPVVDETYSNILLVGASVVIDTKSAQKTEHHKRIEVALTGGEHKIRITKLGYSQSAKPPAADIVAGKQSGLKSSTNVMKSKTAREPGVVDYVVNLVLPLPRKTIEIALPMTSDWKRVSNSAGILVGGTAFSTWFNNTFMNDATYSRPTDDSGALIPIKNIGKFNDVFDRILQFRADPLTLEEFIALFMVMMKEVGGTFKPLGEGGPLKYFFEPKGSKQSYNHGSNRPAGDLLAGLQGSVFSTPILTPPIPAKPATATTPATPAVPNDQALIAQWNSDTTYPSSLGKVTVANLKECDFYKYRGHTFIQVTWHNTYLNARKFVQLLAAHCGVTGKNNAEILDKISTSDMEKAIETDPAINFALMVEWFNQGRWNTLLNVNDLQFANFGTAVGGIGYSDFDTLCTDLRTAMIAAGPNLGP